jgi:hypothetical protein
VTRRAQGESRFVTRDRDIRQALLRDLRKMYNDAEHDLIVEEFGCNTARTDIAVINGSLHAFEIKSDSDTLDRLPSQIEAYQGVYEYISLICGNRLITRARLQIPVWWGLQVTEYKNGCLVLKQLRAPKINPKQNALSLAKMLWKNEALSCLRRHGYKKGVTSKNTAEEVSLFISDHLPVHILCQEVRNAIKSRGGSGFAKRSTLNDGLCTTESTAPLERSSSLSWLLSQQYQHRPD